MKHQTTNFVRAFLQEILQSGELGEKLTRKLREHHELATRTAPQQER